MRDKSLDDVLSDISEGVRDRNDSYTPSEEPASDLKHNDDLNSADDLDARYIEEEDKSDLDFAADEPEPDIDEVEIEEPANYQEPGPANDVLSDADIIDSNDDRSFNFTIKGDRSWNTREPYVINIDQNKLNENYNDLSTSFYFVEKPETESSSQGKIRRAILKNITGSSKELLNRYREFIFRAIFLQVEEFGSFYNLKGDNLNLFIYHTGAFTIFRIIINIFQTQKIGFCYKQMANNKVAKHMPLEFIKEVTLGWYEDNINIYELPFNGIHEYNETKRMVSAKYYSELEKYNKKLDQIIIRLKLNNDKNFNKEEYYRSKWDEWFGRANIFLFNRFIERTIFKYIDSRAP